MKTKRFVIVVSGLIISVALHGCSKTSEPAIQYEGKYQKVSTVEEIMAETLEMQNPDSDIDVQILFDEDDN